MEVDIRPATVEDIEEIIPILRQADINEADALGVDVEKALKLSLKASSRAWSGRADGHLVNVFGVASYSMLNRIGSPWLMASHHVEKYQVPFLRGSRRYLKKMLALYPYLENYVDERNAVAINWLKWLGFHMEPAKPYGPKQLPFHRFTLRN